MPSFARALLLFAALALALPVVATAQAGAASQPAPNRSASDSTLARSLQDNVWTLQSASEASGQAIPGLTVPGQTFALRFDAQRVAVTGGCNNMSGSWRLNAQGRLVVGRLTSTMKACEPALMQADSALSAVLARRRARA